MRKYEFEARELKTLDVRTANNVHVRSSRTSFSLLATPLTLADMRSCDVTALLFLRSTVNATSVFLPGIQSALVAFS